MSKDLKATTPLLYVSDGACGCVLVFLQNRDRLVGVITVNGGPQGITTDASGDLFVAEDILNGTQVLEYPPHALQPSQVLQDPENAFDVAVGSNGTVYVSNSGPEPSILVYANGSSNPTSELLDINAAAGWGIAIDKKDNVFWGIQTATGFQIDRFVHGTTFPIKLRLQVTDTPYSLGFDREGRLLVSQPALPAINEYVLPGTLARQFGKTGSPLGVAHNALHFAFVADGQKHVVEKYRYSDGSLASTISIPNFDPIDVAVFPQP